MSLPEDLLRGIYAYGFEKPSAIQQRAVKPSMLGRDLIAQAQSGELPTNSVKSVVIVVVPTTNSLKIPQLNVGAKSDELKLRYNTIFRV